MTPTPSANLAVGAACLLVVLLHAARRFNTPEADRLSTTRRAFELSRLGYLLATVALFALIATLAGQPQVFAVLGLADAAKVAREYAAPPVLAAVVLTTLLPQVPVLKTLDEALLRHFRRLGRIPSAARQLADQLTPDRLPLGAAALAEARRWVEDEPDVPAELAARLAAPAPADAADTAGVRLARLVLLHRAADRLSRDPAYAEHFRRDAEAWRKLADGFRVFAAQSLAFFVLFDRLAPRAGEEEGASGDALRRAQAWYRTIGEGVHTAHAEFLARALIATEPSEAAVQARLRLLGFDAREIACAQPPVGAILFLGAMLAAGMLAFVAVVRPPEGRMPPALLAVSIAATQMCGVLAAVLPKFWSAAFRPGPDGQPPYLGWLATSALAFAAALFVDRVAIAMGPGGAAAAWDSAAAPLGPSAPLAAVLALCVSVLCDLDGIGARPGAAALASARRRWALEGLATGVAMALAMGVCVSLLQMEARSAAATGVRWVPFALSFAIGFAAGSIAPRLYRDATARPAEGRGSAGRPVRAAAAAAAE